MPIAVREEEPADVPMIREINVRAFGRPQEANLVDALRANGAVVLSLVATAGDGPVGHVLYSPISIGDATGAALAPMAVLPEHQRKGVGAALVVGGTERLSDAGCPFIIVLGHAAYYSRFGFAPASAHGIRCEWEVPENAFMVLILDPVKMRCASGLAKYRREFSAVT